MLFNSREFLFVYLPITLAMFFALGSLGLRRTALVWVVLASLFFYAWWDPRNLPIILGSMAWNFAMGRLLANRERGPLTRKLLLTLGVAANLGLLGYYKYANFFVDNVNTLAGTHYALAAIVLPLGISFFTFQQISYIVDAYRGESRVHHFVHYCLFVTFFPHLIAGPLVHHGEMLPQFTSPSAFLPRRRYLEAGLTYFFMGLFKKVVISDGVALYATPVFAAAAHGTTLSFLEAWCGALAYTMQLYFDFSAYSDMAIGLALLFGIRLPLNFNSPYKAHSIVDFWRRWHMTLSRFLRNYLYTSLGGNRRGPTRRYVNLLLTMLLGGLWHGAGWTFIIWGGLHGGYLIVNHAWRTLRGKIFAADAPVPKWERISAQGLTFLAVVVGWVLFNSPNVKTAGAMLSSMSGGHGIALPDALLGAANKVPGLVGGLSMIGVKFARLPNFWGPFEVAVLAALLAVAFFAPNTQEIMQRIQPGESDERAQIERRWQYARWMRWRPTNGWAVAMSAVTIVTMLYLSRISQFLYFQF